jgi:uncharacterized membrane protein
MQPLGFLNPDLERPQSDAFAVSADGATVVGLSNNEPFRWTPAGGMQRLLDGGMPAGALDEGWANGVNADGSIIVGVAPVASRLSEAFLCRTR